MDGPWHSLSMKHDRVEGGSFQVRQELLGCLRLGAGRLWWPKAGAVCSDVRRKIVIYLTAIRLSGGYGWVAVMCGVCAARKSPDVCCSSMLKKTPPRSTDLPLWDTCGAGRT
jgi:hypothetical protein